MRLGGWAKSIKGRKTAFTVTFRSNLFVKKKKKRRKSWQKWKKKTCALRGLFPWTIVTRSDTARTCLWFSMIFFFDFLGIMSNKYGVRVTVAFGKNLTTNIAFYQPKYLQRFLFWWKDNVTCNPPPPPQRRLLHIYFQFKPGERNLVLRFLSHFFT